VWTRAGKGDIKCGSCHGAPPSNHADNRCELCHGAAYADGGVDVALHLDGKVELRNGGEKCDSCHSGPDSPTFIDLRGRGADAGVQTVGAHDAHLHASRLRGPLTCNECHLVPDKVSAVGHIDSPPPAKVFPSDLGGLAWKQGAMPTYNAANATCGSVYCHGGGDFGHPDTAPMLLRTPSWTGKSDQAACGTCHGLPPQDGTFGHAAALTTPCVLCHSGTVSADGGIIFSSLPDGGLTSKHLDGKITGQ
jgi:predicted CxxxxCH...CXXCH cytochrome family protein